MSFSGSDIFLRFCRAFVLGFCITTYSCLNNRWPCLTILHDSESFVLYAEFAHLGFKFSGLGALGLGGSAGDPC